MIKAKIQRALARLPDRLRWAPHNLLAHPLSELLYQAGLHRAGDWVHDATVPPHEPGTGRG